jgi:hypothetical protein
MDPGELGYELDRSVLDRVQSCAFVNVVTNFLLHKKRDFLNQLNNFKLITVGPIPCC